MSDDLLTARSEIDSQHHHLRELIDIIGSLARSCTMGSVVPDMLRRIDMLHQRLAAHQQHEMESVRRTVTKAGRLTSVELGQLVHEHDAMHAKLLAGVEEAQANGLTEERRARLIIPALDAIGDHMDAEEVNFFGPLKLTKG